MHRLAFTNLHYQHHPLRRQKNSSLNTWIFEAEKYDLQTCVRIMKGSMRVSLVVEATFLSATLKA